MQTLRPRPIDLWCSRLPLDAPNPHSHWGKLFGRMNNSALGVQGTGLEEQVMAWVAVLAYHQRT
jgi:hypothetical protein